MLIEFLSDLDVIEPSNIDQKVENQRDCISGAHFFSLLSFLFVFNWKVFSMSKFSTKFSSRKFNDHNRRLADIHRENVRLCRKIIDIWKNYHLQIGAIDCRRKPSRKRIR